MRAKNLSLSKNEDLGKNYFIDKPHKYLDKNKNKNIESINIIVGPEGGLNPEEIFLSYKNSFKSMCCGPRILRMEPPLGFHHALSGFFWRLLISIFYQLI